MKKTGASRCAIFDLDGTLIDSREDLADSVNLMRGEFGLDPLPLKTVVSYVGNGIKKLVERALAGERQAKDLQTAYQVMMDCYKRNLVEKTTLYPGVFEGVNALKDAGWKLALISNKPTDFCRIILDHFRIELAFSEIIGGTSEFPMKPDPAALNFVLEKTKSEAAKSWVLGDNYTDIVAGEKAGMKKCYAAYGFGDPKDNPYDLKVASFAEFVAALSKEK